MFLCEGCSKSTKSRESMNALVSEKRNKEYYIGVLKHRRNNNKIILYKRPSNEEIDTWKKEGFELISEKITRGWEIEKELKLCSECFNKKLEEHACNNSRQ